MTEQKDRITLTAVRLSFPNLFKPKSVNQGAPKFSASFLIDKKDQAAQNDALRAVCLEVATAKWGKKIPSAVKYCVHDGAEKDEFAGYGDGVMFVSSNNERRPPVVDRDLTPLTEDDQRPYAGCYVNAKIRLWAQDNNFGKRVNAQLLGVQFCADGEAFGVEPFDAGKEFEKLEGDPQTPETDNAPDDTDPTTGKKKLPF